jgi:hypothetical protein
MHHPTQQNHPRFSASLRGQYCCLCIGLAADVRGRMRKTVVLDCPTQPNRTIRVFLRPSAANTDVCVLV